jgi:aryl-alcohol dehydrogenase-like predicted oxidoreductase
MDLAVRWVLDQPGITAALWGARHPAELEAVAGALDWHLDAEALAAIDQILRQTIPEPVGPEFMAPPARKSAAA